MEAGKAGLECINIFCVTFSFTRSGRKATSKAFRLLNLCRLFGCNFRAFRLARAAALCKVCSLTEPIQGLMAARVSESPKPLEMLA